MCEDLYSEPHLTWNEQCNPLNPLDLQGVSDKNTDTYLYGLHQPCHSINDMPT
jgi:hypothetical protein